MNAEKDGKSDSIHEIGMLAPLSIVARSSCVTTDIEDQRSVQKKLKNNSKTPVVYRFSSPMDKDQRAHSRFSWSRSIGAHSKTPEHVQDWLPVNALASLPVSWRFGEDCPKLLRYASIAYACKKDFSALEDVNAGIWSIEAFSHQLNYKQRSLLPRTKMRVFVYQNESYFGYDGHGHLRSIAQKITREDKNDAERKKGFVVHNDTGTGSKNTGRQNDCVDERVAISEDILIQGIHSGLLYLSARKHGHVRDDGSAVLSLFYCNPSRRVFQTMAHAVLQDAEIMKAYGDV